MKSLVELGADECRFALTDSPAADRSWSHARLGASGPGSRKLNVGGGAYPHQFCGEPVVGKGPYCAAHKKLCHRGMGKDARSLEEMIYAIDKSQYRGRSPYADHTDPVDEELRRSAA